MNQTQRAMMIQLLASHDTGVRSNGFHCQKVAAEAARQLLSLRTQGLVASTNDGQAYQLWTLTPGGRVAATTVQREVEEEARLRSLQEQEAQRSTNDGYILWNPKSEHPPRVVYPNLNEARRVQGIMMRRWPNETFFICPVTEGKKLVPPKPAAPVVQSVSLRR